MGVVNYFDVDTTRRLSTMLLASGGALTFAAFNLIGAGVAAGNEQFAAKVSESLNPLMYCLYMGLAAFIMATLAEHPEVPKKGGPWSRQNMLGSAFPLISVSGLFFLIYGTICLFGAAKFPLG